MLFSQIIPPLPSPITFLRVIIFTVFHSKSLSVDLYIPLDMYIKDWIGSCQRLGGEVEWGDAGQMVQTSSYKKL